MELAWVVPVAGLIAVLFAFWLARDVLRRDTGTPEMQAIAGMIFEGAMAFLRRQYRTIAMLAVVTAVVIGVITGVFEEDAEFGLLTGFAFVVGAAASALSGYIGMYISVRSNLRTAAAPTMKATPVRMPNSTSSSKMPTIAPMTTAVTTASMAMVRYWRRRNAIAPSKIMPAISCISGVPVSRLRTSRASHRANSTAMSPATGTTHTSSMRSSPLLGQC
jgi:hypothetical protein